jgi:hypothetical protein
MLSKSLAAQKRANEGRLAAISQTLWDYAHRGFPYHPLYWTSVIRNAMGIDSREKIKHPLYDLLSVGPRTALMWEWILMPGRHVMNLLRALKAFKSGPRYRRSI